MYKPTIWTACHTRMGEAHGPPRRGSRRHPAAAQGGLGHGRRLRRRLHGHRPGRPDPAVDRTGSARHTQPGVPALHLVLPDHRRGDAADRLRLQPHRRQEDAAARSRLRGGLRRSRRHLRHGRPAGRLPGGLGPRQRAVRLHRPRGDRRRGGRRQRRGDPALRVRARPRHGLRPAARRGPGQRQLALPVLRHRHPDGDRLPVHHGVPEGAAEAGPQDLDPGPAQGARPRRSGLGRDLGVLLQLHVLHRAGLHAVRAEHDPVPVRRGVLRLGRAARGVLGARRPAHAEAVRLAEGARRLAGAARGRRPGARLRQPHRRDRLHHPVRCLHRREQHRLHRTGPRRVGRPAPGGERGLQLRPLVRGRGGALLRAEDRGVDRHPRPVRGRGGHRAAGRGRGRRPAPGPHPRGRGAGAPARHRGRRHRLRRLSGGAVSLLTPAARTCGPDPAGPCRA
ncbi:hypothetical protein SGPA1_11983 [Streptomyces misionensis JCM 4497]